MKIITSLLFICLSFNAYSAKPVKAKKNVVTKGKSTLKPEIDFNPKKLTTSVSNANGPVKIVEKIEIDNSGQAGGQYRVVFYDYSVNQFGKLDIKRLRANTKNVKRGLLEYIKYDSAPFYVEKNQKKLVEFQIEIPKNAVGTKFAHFSVQPYKEINFVDSPEKVSADKKKSSLQMKLNILGLVVVDIANSGIKKVDAEYNFDSKFKKHIVVASNIGDHYIPNAVASILVLDSKNKLVEKLPLAGKNVALNPDEKQAFITSLSKPYPKGDYTALITVAGENGGFIFSKKFSFKVDEAPVSKPIIHKNKKK